MNASSGEDGWEPLTSSHVDIVCVVYIVKRNISHVASSHTTIVCIVYIAKINYTTCCTMLETSCVTCHIHIIYAHTSKLQVLMNNKKELLTLRFYLIHNIMRLDLYGWFRKSL